uniref:Uncharacterized protein n=1 Tax=Globisporangium ultimum (strain ATCC 200006 / CBS 805.95 / DAOM BR144) TaxID=431595 RepID=K3WHH7_GLOUD
MGFGSGPLRGILLWFSTRNFQSSTRMLRSSPTASLALIRRLNSSSLHRLSCSSAVSPAWTLRQSRIALFGASSSSKFEWFCLKAEDLLICNNNDMFVLRSAEASTK